MSGPLVVTAGVKKIKTGLPGVGDRLSGVARPKGFQPLTCCSVGLANLSETIRGDACLLVGLHQESDPVLARSRPVLSGTAVNGPGLSKEGLNVLR